MNKIVIPILTFLVVVVHAELIIQFNLIRSPGILAAMIFLTILIGGANKKSSSDNVRVFGNGIFWGGILSGTLAVLFVLWLYSNYR